MLTYKFRLYPTTMQERILDDTLETCRKLYNLMLDDRINNHASFFEQKRKLVELKKGDKFLKQVHSQVLQDVVLRLDKAFQSYSTGLSRFPKFKRRGRYNSFTYPQHGIGFKLLNGRMRLGCIGEIKVKLHRAIEGRIKTASVIRDVDQWFLALSVKEERKPILEYSDKAVGLDLGVSNIIATSNRSIIESPKFIKQTEERTKKLQRELSRKKKSSRRREKTRILLAKAWRRVRRQRNDFAHKLSDKLTKEYGTIVFEDLNIKRMVKNHSLASAIMDSIWGKLRQYTVYKAERRGGRVIFVNPDGTSQKCSGCGELVPKKLSERVHKCSRCGLILDRDVNAARNILALGLERALTETKPLLIHKRVGKFGQGSEKPTSFRRG